jgi:ornithine cyclodeaminase/alanine dehydrogenase-like protein (mu-crystallin family)
VLIGELHDALESGAMSREDVDAELGEIVAGAKPAASRRTTPPSSTAPAPPCKDVTVAAVVYEQALQQGIDKAADVASDCRAARCTTRGVVAERARWPTPCTADARR